MALLFKHAGSIHFEEMFHQQIRVQGNLLDAAYNLRGRSAVTVRVDQMRQSFSKALIRSEAQSSGDVRSLVPHVNDIFRP